MHRFRLCPIAGLVLGVVAASSTASSAAAEVLFDCPIGAQQLSITLAGDTAIYTFGPQGAPETVISAAPRDLNYLPWAGMGTSMPEAVQFANAGTTYKVWYAVQKQMGVNAPLAPTQGGVRVMQASAMLADLVCTAPPSVYALERIYDAKLAAGHCYDWQNQSWGTACAE